VGFEQHKAHPDLGDDSRFWLRIMAEDAAPFLDAFRDSPDLFHEFLVEQRVGKETRRSTLAAQIVEIEEGPAESRVLIRPHPSYEAATKGPQK
jgi:hypothetical protein